MEPVRRNIDRRWLENIPSSKRPLCLHPVRSLTPTTSQSPCSFLLRTCVFSSFPSFHIAVFLLLVHLLVALLFFFFFYLFFCQLLSFPSLLSFGGDHWNFFLLPHCDGCSGSLFFLFFVLVSHLCFVFCIGEVFLNFASFFCEACLGLVFPLPPLLPSLLVSFGYATGILFLSVSLSLSFFLSFSRLHSFFSQPLLSFFFLCRLFYWGAARVVSSSPCSSCLFCSR